MMGFGWQELLIVLVIVMIVFGAGKLPSLGSSLGRGLKEFKAEASAAGAEALGANRVESAEDRGLRADRI